MTIVYSILRTGGSTDSVNVAKIAESDLTLTGTTDLKNGGKRSMYKIANGTGLYPTTIASQVKPAADGLSNVVLLAINSWACAADGVTGVNTYRPISAVLTISVPLDVPIEPEDIMIMIENLFSLTYHSVAAGVPASTRISQMGFYGLSDTLKA